MTMQPVTDQTRHAVWNTLCDLEWNWRYYGEMADKYRRRYRVLRLAIVAGLLLELAVVYFALSTPWASYIAIAGGLLLLSLTMWDAFSDYAQDAATLRVTAFTCDELKWETEALWRSIETYDITTRDAEAGLHSILKRWASATQQVRPGTDQRLNRKTSAAANQDISSRYALE